MRDQENNPVWQQMAHMLGDDERYPAKWVDIFWNKDENYKIIDVEVVFIPRTEVSGTEGGDHLWDKYAAYNKRWSSDIGNSVSTWMEESGFTPAGLFGVLLETGFGSKAEMYHAIKEFAHIRECEWAREMVFAWERELNIGD